MKTHDGVEPRLIVVVGTNNGGQCELAQALAIEYGYHYLDADDLINDEARAYMEKGRFFTEAMREPWIVNTLRLLQIGHKQGQSYVLSQAGLKRVYRRRFRRLPYAQLSDHGGEVGDMASNMLFLLLDDKKPLATRRIRSHSNYFLPASMQDHSFESIDLPVNEDDVKVLDADVSMANLTYQAKAEIDSYFSLRALAYGGG